MAQIIKKKYAMSGINFLADTNAFIYLLDGKFAYPELLEGNWAFSYITEIELLSKNNLVDNDELVIKEMF